MCNLLARTLSKLAKLLPMLVVSLLAVNPAHAVGYGSLTITDAPLNIEPGDPPTIRIHAEWSHASGMSIQISLNATLSDCTLNGIVEKCTLIASSNLDTITISNIGEPAPPFYTRYPLILTTAFE